MCKAVHLIIIDTKIQDQKINKKKISKRHLATTPYIS